MRILYAKPFSLLDILTLSLSSPPLPLLRHLLYRHFFVPPFSLYADLFVFAICEKPIISKIKNTLNNFPRLTEKMHATFFCLSPFYRPPKSNE